MEDLQDSPQRIVPLSRTPLTAPNLQAVPELASLDKAQFIKSYLLFQHSYRADYEKEGRKYQAAWDKDNISTDVPEPAQAVGVVGFATPILKARAPEKKASDSINIDEHHIIPHETAKSRNTANIKKSEPKTRTKEDSNTPARCSSPKTRKRTLEDFGMTTEKGKERKKRKRKSQTPVKARENEEKERAEVLAGRRERRRTKKAIVEPQVPAQTTVDACGTESKGTKSKGDIKKVKKGDISAGLALMHGFSATNIGASRLTMKPTLGVFTKGKASAKTDIPARPKYKSRLPNSVWTESIFLNNSKSKISDEQSVLSISSNESCSISTSTVRESGVQKRRKTKRTASERDEPQNKKEHSILNDSTRSKRPAVIRTPTKSEAVDSSTSQRSKSASPPEKAKSVIWDIESTANVVPAESTDGIDVGIRSSPRSPRDGTPILNTLLTAWHNLSSSVVPMPDAQDTLDSKTRPKGLSRNDDQEKRTLAVFGSQSSALSLCPSHSASQVVQAPSPQPLTSSKYFRHSLPINSTKRNDLLKQNSKGINDSYSTVHCREAAVNLQADFVPYSTGLASRTGVDEDAWYRLGSENVPDGSSVTLDPRYGRRAAEDCAQPDRVYQPCLDFHASELVDSDYGDMCEAHEASLYSSSAVDDLVNPHGAIRTEDIGLREAHEDMLTDNGLGWCYNGPDVEEDLDVQYSPRYQIDVVCRAADADYSQPDRDYDVTAYAYSDEPSWPSEDLQEPPPTGPYETPPYDHGASACREGDLSYTGAIPHEDVLVESADISQEMNDFNAGALVLPTLAQVEEDVAKGLQGHWLPQRL